MYNLYMKKLLFLVIAMLLVGAVLFVGSRIGIYKSPDIENGAEKSAHGGQQLHVSSPDRPERIQYD